MLIKSYFISIYITYHSLQKFKTLFIIAEKYCNMYRCVYFIYMINEL